VRDRPKEEVGRGLSAEQLAQDLFCDSRRRKLKGCMLRELSQSIGNRQTVVESTDIASVLLHSDSRRTRVQRT
jgi:hypothetical protein